MCVFLMNTLNPVAKAEDCDKIIQAADLTVQKYKDLTASQGELILQLTEQRNDAIKAQGNNISIGQMLLWTLVGAASATVVIGVRR